jgi:hypothetical protein
MFVATTSDAVAVLFAEFESAVVVVTVAVWLIAVPDAVPAFTFTVNVIVPEPPDARLESVQVSVARVQTQPAGPVRETAVVFAGNVSTRLTLAASLGPALLTSCVYVMLFPASTGTGPGVFVIERLAVLPT